MPRRAKAPTAAKPPGGLFSRGSTASTFYLFFMTATDAPSGTQMPGSAHMCRKSFSKSQTDTASDLYGTRDETSFSKSQRVLGDSGGSDRRGSSDDWDAGEIRRDAAFPSKPLISAVLGQPHPGC